MPESALELYLPFIGALVLIGILAAPLSQRLGAPILLVVLAAGMLAGEDGPGGAQFDDFSSAFSIGSLALAVILFAGGLETDLRRSRGARLPALLLATVGVVVTAMVVGVLAAWTLRAPLEAGLLLGAVVASTDAAATFLAIFPVVTPGPIMVGFLNLVFVVVVASPPLQGPTISLLARRLKLMKQPDGG